MLDNLAIWIVQSQPNWLPGPLNRWALRRFVRILRITDAMRQGTEFERGEPHAD